MVKEYKVEKREEWIGMWGIIFLIFFKLGKLVRGNAQSNLLNQKWCIKRDMETLKERISHNSSLK